MIDFPVERARRLAVAKQKRDLCRDLVAFARWLSPEGLSDRDAGRLRALQERIRRLHPEVNVDALDFLG